MSLLRSLPVLMVPVLGGCVFGSEKALPPVEYSAGFFVEFDQMVDDTTARGSLDDQATTFRVEFARRLEEGPGPGRLLPPRPVVTGELADQLVDTGRRGRRRSGRVRICGSDEGAR